MARARNPNRENAYQIYKENEGSIKPNKIATILNENINNIRSWKSQDKWDVRLYEDKKPGAPKGNQNAKGSKGPIGNFNAVKHGLYIPDERFTKGNLSKILPKTMINTIKELCEESPVDKLWRSILIQEARILNMQKITHVKDKNDMSKELKKKIVGDSNIEEYEIQFAWDKENNSVSAMSKAMKTLSDMIKQFEDMIHKNWDLVSEEQRLKVELLKRKLSDDDEEEVEDDGFIDALKSEVGNIWD